ncbi:nucleoside hydrolase [Proteiniphilum sp.]|uniref:nucleoside hydrolase n=1 Tax=Proteiniphilum sp. TaxID=1926877 RepID=UPI002B2048C0|nr:nucleoside hydrolase [Proteiniphilum sp.]MEA4917954.1 nucleoside hydrolase [Proteiniphilum sp.]
MNRIKQLLFFPIVIVSLLSCTEGKTKGKIDHKRMNVIFDTDMGNDVDDALALDMLYKYTDQDRINLLGIPTNKRSPYCVEYIDIMNNWYGYPDIPVGIVVNGSEKDNEDNFVRKVSQMEKDGKPAFERSIKNYETLPTSVSLYRKLLASQEDHSVNIISVGFSTNLAQLLDSQGDEFSQLTGKELVARKVKLLSAMMGNFENENFSEFNVHCDIPSAQKVIKEWPTPIVVSPFELGEKILYPGASIENDFKWKEPNPLAEGYKAYLEMPYDRQTWDLTSVLYVVEKDKGFFNESPSGTINIDDKGVTRFTPHEDGKHKYLTINEQQKEDIKNYFIDLITQRPKKYQD